jgi:cytidyltransferase-like protein
VKVSRVVYTAGTFDLLHLGHLNLIDACRKIAGPEGRVVVGVNSDALVEKHRGKRAVMTEGERARIVTALKDVNIVIINKDPQDRMIERALGPFLSGAYDRFMVVGSDWATKDYYSQIGVTQEWLDINDITLCYVPYTSNVSSTQIRARLRDQA